MNNAGACPECGAKLPPDAPQGICPKCLMRGVLDAAPGSTPSVSPFRDFVAPSVEELAKHFPKLEILQFIGRGGMGAVYKARQEDLDRVVALKILPPAAGRDPSFAERFAREARNQASLHHSNIVAVFDYGKASVYYFFVMEWVDGTNLRERIVAGQIQPPDALNIIPQICEALQYAHDEGVIHRDIKPDNILIDQKGRVKIADFGIAKLREPAPDNATITDPQHAPPHTPGYAAPEQRERGGQVDHRADIYSLGVVFYEMLTGHRPHAPNCASPSQKVHVDPRIDDVVFRALEELPERRYQRVNEIKAAVDLISTRRKRPLVVFVVVGLLATVSVWLALSRSTSPEPSRPKPPNPAPMPNETKWTTPGSTFVCNGFDPSVAYEARTKGVIRPVHLAYSTLDKENGGLWYRKTADGGKNWTQPIRLNDAPANKTSLAAAHDQVVVVWHDRLSQSVVLKHSKDSGGTWSKPISLIEQQTEVIDLSVWVGANEAPQSFVIALGNRSFYFIEFFGEGSSIDVQTLEQGARYSRSSYLPYSTHEFLTVVAAKRSEERALLFVRDFGDGRTWKKSEERQVPLETGRTVAPRRVVKVVPQGVGLLMAGAIGDSDGYVSIHWADKERPVRVYQMGDRRPWPLHAGVGHTLLAFDGDGQGNGVVAWAGALSTTPTEIHVLFLTPVPVSGPSGESIIMR